MPRRAPLLALLLLPWLLAPTCTPAPLLPALAASSPAAGETVARSAWLVLDFAGSFQALSASHAAVRCAGVWIPPRPNQLDADTLILQPELPAGAACEIELDTTAGQETIAFQTQAAGAPFEVVFDRTAPDKPLPFPDDLYLVPNPANPTGFGLDLVLPNATAPSLNLLTALAGVVEAEADGWSPLGHISVEIDAPADPTTLPLDRAASLDPLSTVALIDMTPGSPSFGERIPFSLIPRSDTFAPNPVVHAWVISPGIALEPEGTYGFVATDRVLDAAGEPLARSSFFEAAVAAPQAGEAPEITATRPLVAEVLAAAEALSPVPIPQSDVVAAMRITIRSTGHFVDDPLSMRQDVQATPPNVVIDVVDALGDPNVAALVYGTFDVPVWRTGPYFDRGPDGLPLASGTESVEFVLALPAEAAVSGHAPLVMYQHGNPGSAQLEVPSAAVSHMGAAGFAVAGFTDVINRSFAGVQEQTIAILANVLLNGASPDFYVQTYGEQMAFAQALKTLGTLDVLPIGAPDGVPDVDPSVLGYEGISYGSNHAQAFLAYEPQIDAAALVVGAVRFAELLEHQDRTLPLGGAPLLRTQLPGFLPGLRAADLWMGLHLFALSYDPQDPHNHARFLYREPLGVDGTTQKASILVVEGIDDSFTANNSTRSLARQLGGIPQLTGFAPVPVPDLPELAGPIQGNVDANTTAAIVQYACPGFEGHYCAQGDSEPQRVDFYESALSGVPVIE